MPLLSFGRPPARSQETSGAAVEGASFKSKSMPEQKLFGVEQGPLQVFPGTAAVLRLGDVLQGGFALFGRRNS